MTNSSPLQIRYRNIQYLPKGSSLIKSIPGEVQLSAEPGKGTYEPLAVHLHEYGYEFSSLYYEHQFAPDQSIRDRYASQQLDKWHDAMSYKPKPPIRPEPSTRTHVLACISIGLILIGAYALLSYRPTYVARIECASPTVKITVQSKDKSVIDRLNPPKSCKIERSKK